MYQSGSNNLVQDVSATSSSGAVCAEAQRDLARLARRFHLRDLSRPTFASVDGPCLPLELVW